MVRFVLRRQVAPEPTSRLTLRWGDYQGRYVVGILLLLSGAALVAQTTAFTLALGVVGSVLHVTGWLVQPANFITRVTVALPSMFACWITISGPKTMWPLGICLACWLLVRRRPWATFVAVLLPLGVGLIAAALYSHVADKPTAFAMTVVAVVAGAWLAREYALRVRVRSGAPRPADQ